MIMKRIKMFCRKLRLLLLSLAVVVSAGWVGDFAQDLIKQLEPWWTETTGFTSTTTLILGVLLSFVIFCATALWLYHLRGAFLGTRARMVGQTSGKQRTVLIMGLSPDNPAQAEGLQRMRDTEIEQYIQNGPRHPWQQNLRIVWDHMKEQSHPKTMKAILVIASEASCPHFSNFQAILMGRLGDAIQRGIINGGIPEIKMVTSDGIDFEDYNSVTDALNSAVDKAMKDHEVRHNEICIDATAGLKTFSIAAAITTLNRQLVFSYVNNNGEPRYYDAKIDIGTLGEE
ncbi:hypothetical protein [Insolitispirillum peregrinum]|uniref:hypothetical protein n=1 Tax=Insolitispirillum peregrinum TaxID=80876 RepID=UPI00360EF72A